MNRYNKTIKKTDYLNYNKVILLELCFLILIYVLTQNSILFGIIILNLFAAFIYKIIKTIVDSIKQSKYEERERIKISIETHWRKEENKEKIQNLINERINKIKLLFKTAETFLEKLKNEQYYTFKQINRLINRFINKYQLIIKEIVEIGDSLHRIELYETSREDLKTIIEKERFIYDTFINIINPTLIILRDEELNEEIRIQLKNEELRMIREKILKK
jgi:hypothetical protein